MFGGYQVHGRKVFYVPENIEPALRVYAESTAHAFGVDIGVFPLTQYIHSELDKLLTEWKKNAGESPEAIAAALQGPHAFKEYAAKILTENLCPWDAAQMMRDKIYILLKSMLPPVEEKNEMGYARDEGAVRSAFTKRLQTHTLRPINKVAQQVSGASQQ